MAFEALGNHKQALADLEKAVELNPNYTPAQEALDELRGQGSSP